MRRKPSFSPPMNAATPDSLQLLLAENTDLRIRLEEAEDTLAAIRSGDVDALVVGEDIYTLDSANTAMNLLRKDVLAQMDDAVLAVDEAQHIIFMNPAAERQYRTQASDALGRALAEVFRETWPSDVDRHAADARLHQTGSYREHSIHTRADGTALHVESTVSRLRDAEGAPMGYLAVIRDISERVRADETLQAATTALAKRERQFATLVENSPDVLARLDRQLRHVYMSPVIERYTGLSAAAHLGRTNLELGMAPELAAQWDAALREVFDSGRVGRMKFTLSTPSGDARVLDARLMPEFAEDGSVESVLSIAADVTEQELVDAALRDSQARLKFTLDSARIGEWELDLATDRARHSLRHDRCFGYDQPVPEWGLAILLAHVHPQDRERVAERFRTSAESGQELHFECRVVWPDRSVHWVEVHGSHYSAPGAPRRLLGIIADTTARKAAEEHLRDADRRKDEFLATLAHELRNPLAPIRNALQIMRLTQEPEIHGNARTIIDRQLKQMVHLVDDLLDVSRISQGKVELRLEQADVAAVVQTAIETSKPLIDSGRHELSVRLPAPGTLMVEADVTRLCQIVANLLNNAAKYTPEGGRIEVAAERQGGQALISVQDSGVGIPPQMLPRVFDMFAQVDRTLERSQGGLGIGLALVKRLIEMHGGSVEAHSEGPDRGCRFELRMPLAAPQPATLPCAPAQALQSEPHSNCRVLVVDDNLDSAESLSMVLSMLGYETQMAHDGLEAVRSAERQRPRVVLLDIGLPKLNGHDAARQIRQQPWGRDMLLIALSGWGQEEDRRKSREAGFDHHFVKPVDFEVLTELIAKLASD
jgi:PAS domain S-box-containing protein